MERVLDQQGRWRNKVVAFRMSPEEDALLDAKVRLSGLTKQEYIIDMLNALHDYDLNCGVLFIAYKQYAAMREVHEYIRTMRTGFTVQRNDEYSRLKKTMRLFRGSGGKADRATIQKIAQAIDISEKDTAELIRSGMQNVQL